MPRTQLSPYRQLAGKRGKHRASQQKLASASDDDAAVSVDPDRRLDELELLLRQLTAQARDVVQELGEIKAEIKHINGLDDTMAPAPSQPLGAGSSMTDVVRALHSNFRDRESSLEEPQGSRATASSTNAHTRDRLKAMERVMASAMLRSVADSREPRAGTVDSQASTGTEQPGKWPRFGQDTITRFERGIPSRDGTGRLPHISSASPATDERRSAGSRAQNRDRLSTEAQASARSLTQVAKPAASPTKSAPIEVAVALSGAFGPNSVEADGFRGGRNTRKSSSRQNRYLVGLTGSPLGWGPRIAEP